jgi:hypothetical protein
MPTQPRHHWSRYSLATMFGVVTAVAVVFGVISVLTQRVISESREHFVQVSISGFGGTYTLERLARWQKGLFVHHIKEIDLSPKAWPRVESTAAGKSFPVMRDDDLIVLQCASKLLALDLSGAALTDKALPDLKQLTSLRELNLTDTGLSQEAIHELRAALPDCSIQY